MSGESVLIAAFSGRALAQSARRAGYAPLVADAFGDSDTRTAAAAFRILDGAMRTGFRTKPLIAALDALVANAATPPIGLVLGSGFEDKPRLVAALSRRFKLLGADAETIRACKNPDVFIPALDALGIAHPVTQRAAPGAASGWLSKRTGGTGGRHIRVCSSAATARPRRYFQQRIDGDRLSIGGVFSERGARLGVTRQWIAPSDVHPFRYGGAVSTPDLDAATFGQIAADATAAAREFGISGMASFDFIVADGIANLVDINPRPGASLDVLDDEDGYAFFAHVQAHKGSDVPPMRRRPPLARAAALLHADRGDVTVGDIAWPEWTADRPNVGTTIGAGEPIATVFASAEASIEAEANARARLAELEALVYGRQL